MFFIDFKISPINSAIFFIDIMHAKKKFTVLIDSLNYDGDFGIKSNESIEIINKMREKLIDFAVKYCKKRFVKICEFYFDHYYYDAETKKYLRATMRNEKTWSECAYISSDFTNENPSAKFYTINGAEYFGTDQRRIHEIQMIKKFESEMNRKNDKNKRRRDLAAKSKIGG
jgi:hypothetical protein